MPPLPPAHLGSYRAPSPSGPPAAQVRLPRQQSGCGCGWAAAAAAADANPSNLLACPPALHACLHERACRGHTRLRSQPRLVCSTALLLQPSKFARAAGPAPCAAGHRPFNHVSGLCSCIGSAPAQQQRDTTSSSGQGACRTCRQRAGRRRCHPGCWRRPRACAAAAQRQSGCARCSMLCYCRTGRQLFRQQALAGTCRCHPTAGPPAPDQQQGRRSAACGRGSLPPWGAGQRCSSCCSGRHRLRPSRAAAAP